MRLLFIHREPAWHRHYTWAIVAVIIALLLSAWWHSRPVMYFNPVTGECRHVEVPKGRAPMTCDDLGPGIVVHHVQDWSAPK